MIDYKEVTDNVIIIDLLKQREKIEKQIHELDSLALVRYELESLKEPKEKESKIEFVCPNCGRDYIGKNEYSPYCSMLCCSI